MRTGIITFHRAINYGAILQTYALQKKMIDKGYAVEVIDYRCEHMENFYKTLTFKGKSLKQGVRGLLNFYYTYKKKKHFRRFLNDNIRLSDMVYTKSNIQDSNKVYGQFITGSDQVFNYACSNFDTSYFLDFVTKPNKKLSYAASFGINEIPPKYLDDYKNLLSSFDKFSIREMKGQDLLYKLTQRRSELSVDPVFLLEKEDWLRIAKKPNMERYILIYKLNASDLIYDFARKLANKTKCKIISLNFDFVDELKNRGIKGIMSASVEEFLGYFAYADYVVTNSFHGTAFSIIFHKEFYVEALQKDFKPNDRVESLLKITNLQSCKINSLDDCVLSLNRDFSFSDAQLKTERLNSLKYLESILNE